MTARFAAGRVKLAIGLAILVVLLGAVAAWRLPVALYPPLVPPSMQVTARYPGASADTLAKTVALPIEQQVNAVPGMLYMQSESAADGSYTLNVTFVSGTDMDVAQALLEKRVANLLAALPSAVQVQGVSVQAKSPDGLMFDPTGFTRAAINALYWNLFEAVILVLAAILVFLQDWRAAVLFGIRVVVTIMGAFAAMAAMGFSVKLCTLFAAILAIGLVLDDAVPVAAIGTTLAVFIPPLFLPGLAGKFIGPFAMVIAAAVLISTIVAATLTPTYGRTWHPISNKFCQALAEQYLLLVRRMLGRAGFVALAAVMLGGLAVWGLVQIPRGFLPAEDQGSLLAGGFTMQLELRDGSLDYPKLAAVTRHVVADAATQSGLAHLSSGAMPPALIGRYNLYPATVVRGTAAAGFTSGEAMELMEQVAAHDLPAGIFYDWTAMSALEKAGGGQIFAAFALALLLVYLGLAAYHKNFLAPLSVVLAVPLVLLGPVVALDFLGLDNDVFVQIGLWLLIALASMDAMRIVELARRRRREGTAIIEAALDAARARFRPLLMTSLAFMLGTVPLLLADGAGAASRFSIGITLFSGTIASLGLAALMVPGFFVVMQKFEERRGKPGRGARGKCRSGANRQAALEPTAPKQPGSGIAPVVP